MTTHLDGRESWPAGDRGHRGAPGPAGGHPGHRAQRSGGPARRSVLALAGAGAALAAGGGAWLATRSGPHRHFPVTRPPGTAARPALWSERFRPGHGWAAGGGGTATANPNDTALSAGGTQSFGVTTAGNGVQSFIRREAMPAVDVRGRMIRLVFRVEATAHLRRIGFYLGRRGLADRYYWEVHTHSAEYQNYVGPAEWVTVHLQWADVAEAAGEFALSPDGVPSVRTGLTDMSFAVYDDARGPVAYHLQAVELVEDTGAVFPRGIVSITFDDSFRSVYELARPVMDEHRFRGTVYNIAEAAGQDRYLTVRQMTALRDRSGWEMAGHAYSADAHNRGYDRLTSGQVDADLRSLRGWLVSHGFQSEQFAYPHGAFGATSDGVPIDRIAGEYFAAARSIVSEGAESFRPAMPYRLKAFTGINDVAGANPPGDPVSYLTGPGAKLDRCARDGSWLILCFHQITARQPREGTQISRSAFAEVMAAIARRGIPVATVGEVLAHS